MGSLKQFQTTEEVTEILKCGRIEGNVYYLPDLTLERFQYEEVNKVLVALGAKWDKKARGHVFDYDIRNEMDKVIDTGIVVDWKKSTDFFFTPSAVVSEMIGQIAYYSGYEFIILEPSAGQGHILDIAKSEFPNAKFIVVEQNPMHCQRLKEKGYEPIQSDFLNVPPQAVDIVLMNPPFTYQTEHIMHAYEFLNDDGMLISIASGNILNQNNKKGVAFKEWFEKVRGYNYTLPAYSFKEAGTGVSTTMLIINKDE